MVLQVEVGNLRYELGTLQYQKASVYFPLPAIIGIIAGGSVLILIIIVILIVCRRRSTLAERQFKKMKAQLDALESNVRNECKQGAQSVKIVREGISCEDLTDSVLLPFWNGCMPLTLILLVKIKLIASLLQLLRSFKRRCQT